MKTAFEVPYWPNPITKYAKARLEGRNMSESARAAGYSPALVNQAGARLEAKSQQRIREALDAAGATNDVLAGVIVAGLSATDAEDNVNYRERREYTRLALEAKGELKSTAQVAVQINFPAGLVDMFSADANEFSGE